MAAEGEGRRHNGRSFPALSLCLLLLASTVWSANADWCEGYRNIFDCVLYQGSSACADNSKRKPPWCSAKFVLGTGDEVRQQLPELSPSQAPSPSPRTNLLLW